MALTPEIFNLTEIELQIHALLESSTSDVPGTTDDDYILRKTLANNLIGRWEKVDGTMWAELWVTDKSKVFSAASPGFTLPTDFKSPGGYVRLVAQDGSNNIVKIKVYPARRAQLMNPVADKYAYITGNPAIGYTMNINWPSTDTSANGYQIWFDYYKRAGALSAAADIPEMLDPWFIIYGVVGTLQIAQGQGSRGQLNMQLAEERLGQMQIQNEMVGDYMDETLEDTNYLASGGGFGL